MAKPKPQERRQANLSYEQMKAAIPKIERRLADVEELIPQDITEFSDTRISALQSKLDALLVDVFGADTVEYERYQHGFKHIHSGFWYGGMTSDVIAKDFRKGLESAKAQLVSIKSGFEEELKDAGETSTGKTLKAYEGLELHPAIERAAGKLFRDGHYANAVEDAEKALNALVRLNSGEEGKDGTALMESVFSPKNPVLKFNDLKDDSDIDEQRGFMMLFSGAVAGLRNPRAHKIIKDDPEMALEFIALISLLAKLADKAKK
ncbi:MAG: TIGR02391 family protein [Minisyncoccia bacterium]|jgi:uncharacterized protein (TIGR02391 family)